MDCVEICVIWQLLCPKPMFYSKLSNFPRETFLRIFISWQFTFYTPASLQQFPSFSKEMLEIKLYTNSLVDVLLQCWEQEYSLLWRFSFETSHTEKSFIAAVVPDIRVGKCKDFLTQSPICLLQKIYPHFWLCAEKWKDLPSSVWILINWSTNHDLSGLRAHFNWQVGQTGWKEE